MEVLIYPVRDSDSLHKKVSILANFLHERHLMSLEKSEWRLLLKQFLLENGNFPLRFGKDGMVTSESLVAFAKMMDKFSERIIRPSDPIFYIDSPDILTLSASAGFGRTISIRLSVKK